MHNFVVLTKFCCQVQVARALVKKNLSLIIFPEGTRSKTGRLLPFKKASILQHKTNKFLTILGAQVSNFVVPQGFVHVALQSRLPIVPIVLTCTHLAWRKGSLRVRPTPLTVKYLPPIKTDDWEAEKINDYVDMVHSLYVNHLPDSQKPIDALKKL